MRVRASSAVIVRHATLPGALTMENIVPRGVTAARREAMAERVGFEPTEGYPSAVFKTAAINHSTTSPCCGVRWNGGRSAPAGKQKLSRVTGGNGDNRESLFPDWPLLPPFPTVQILIDPH